MTGKSLRIFNMKNEMKRIKAGGFIIVFVYCLVILVPFYYVIVSSLKNVGQYYSTDMKEVWFPSTLHFENYSSALTKIPLLLYTMNSIILAVLRTTLSVASSAFIAYGFARFEFKGKDFLFVLVLAMMMLPSQVTNIPLFLLFKSVKWTNTFLPLIVPNIFGSPYIIFLLRQFMISIPREMDEAAAMDGCGTFRTFYRIIMPQSIPAVIVGCLFTFMWCWKDLWGPLIFINKSIFYPLPLGLMYFESPTDFQYTVQLAAVVLALIPTVLFYIFGQKYLERGINIADIKG